MKRYFFHSSCLYACLSFSQLGHAVEDDQISDLWRHQGGLSASSDARRQKRKDLRKGHWVHSYGADLQLGFVDNVYSSPEDVGEESSAFLAALAYWQIERRFDKQRSLEIEVDAQYTQFSENEDLNAEDVRFSITYDHDLSDHIKWENDIDVKYSSDSSTDIYGDPYTRSFAFTSYQLSSGIEYDYNNSHKSSGKILYKIKDYEETPTMNSIDWHSSTIRLAHRWKLNDQFKLRTQYDYTLQNYKEEPANNASDGLESVGNPDEEHIFQKINLSAYWYPQDGSKLWAKLYFNQKDDRFEDFESYDEIQYKIGATSALNEHWFIKTEYTLKDRSFNKRPGNNASELLEYDTQKIEFMIRRNIDSKQATYLSLSQAERNSNRETGDVYRDYTVNSLLIGYTINF